MSPAGWAATVFVVVLFGSGCSFRCGPAEAGEPDPCRTIGSMERCRDEASKVTCWKVPFSEGGIHCLRDEVTP